MKQKLVIAATAGGAGAAFALVALLLVMRGNPAVAQVPGGTADARARALAQLSQPDTSSRNWKFLADDVGVLIREDDTLGLRARLYVQRDGLWLPVATDGPADARWTVPTR